MGFNVTGKTRIVGGPASYYNNYTTTNLYVELVFDKNVNTINIINDSLDDPVQVSYDGATLDGEISPGENAEFSVNTKLSIYVKATTGGDTVRIWGW